uniref:AAA+ ATPase domain-containing protein n=1 Tax=viral metagenome TaxID=1070528 RepID=A0A6C0I468_9ZZZZ
MLISKFVLAGCLLLVNVTSFVYTRPPNHPLSKNYHERYLKRLNSKNVTIQINSIYNAPTRYSFQEPNRNRSSNIFEEDEDDYDLDNEDYELDADEINMISKLEEFLRHGRPEQQGNLTAVTPHQQDVEKQKQNPPRVRILINPNLFQPQNLTEPDMEDDDDSDIFDRFGYPLRPTARGTRKKGNKKSENFEVVTKSPLNFTDIGGYDTIKDELYQCIDLLSNFSKYAAYNVRVPKGLIFEGPPGNGKTMLAKALAGEANTSFIAVSGSEFQEKYVGVGASRIRELFSLAKENIPCIVFIDEIDALGRKRSGEGETSGSERDNTLNELLVALDGFKNITGVFIIGATNRVDLLDEALIRPGRIDKRIYIGNPDTKTRRAILNIHSRGKPSDLSVNLEDLVESTAGLSGAQIENLLNEAMLTALRQDRNQFTNVDVDIVLNKMMVGWQPNEHQFTSDIIDHIAIHELGHAVVGLLSKHHAKMTKIVINLFSPKSPAYTVFESSVSNILTREALFEHLMILLSGRIAEELIYGRSVTTGAINDFEEAARIAERMITYYGLGKKPIYPKTSEKYKELIDTEVASLISDAYTQAEFLLSHSKELILEGAELLKSKKVMKADELLEIMNSKYSTIFMLGVRK